MHLKKHTKTETNQTYFGIYEIFEIFTVIVFENSPLHDGTCVTSQTIPMQSLCTRQIKSCCDGFQKVKNTTLTITIPQNSSIIIDDKNETDSQNYGTKNFDNYDILGLPFSLSDFENTKNNISMEKLDSMQKILELGAGFKEFKDKHNENVKKEQQQHQQQHNGNGLSFIDYPSSYESDEENNRDNLDDSEKSENFENDALFCEKISQCGGLYHRTEYTKGRPEYNEISTLDYPITYPNSLSCEWHIEAPPGHIVELNMGYIEIESNRDCQYDKLRIWDDAVERVLCGFGRPKPIVSKAENLYLRFNSDTSGRHRGFSAHYKFVKRDDEACKHPFEWNACPASCNITCDDVNPFNENRRTCDERDSESYPLSSHEPPSDDICQPACACPQHKPLMSTNPVTGEVTCIAADQCSDVPTCGVATRMDESALAKTLSGYLKEDFELVKKSHPNYVQKRAKRKRDGGKKNLGQILPNIQRRQRGNGKNSGKFDGSDSGVGPVSDSSANAGWGKSRDSKFKYQDQKKNSSQKFKSAKKLSNKEKSRPEITMKSAKINNIKKASNSWYRDERPILNGKAPIRAKYLRPRWKTRRNRAYKFLKSLVESDDAEELEGRSARKKRMAAQLRIKGGNVSKKGTWPCK